MEVGGDEVKVTVDKEGKLKKSYFDVLGVCCSTEVVLIEKVLKNINGVQSVRVIVPTRTLIVVHDELLLTQSQIVKVLNLARMEANVRTTQGPNFTKKWPSPYTIACGLLLVVSLGHYAFRPLQWVAVASVAVGIYPIIRKSFVAIKNLILDINVLAIMAVIGTMLLKDFLEAATIVFLFTIAEWLESRASQQATVVMSELLNMEPEKAVIAETGEVVNAAEVKLGTVLAVKAGEVIPIDGVVVEGEAEVDEKMLTGESFPVVKQKDATVLAGTMNLNGYIAVKTTAVAEDCVVSKMARLVEEAQSNKSKTQRLIDKCAKYYTPAVLVLSICLVVIPSAMRVHNRDWWYHLALVVLVSACPCGLILSTPVATFCALSKAAKSGVLLKGGDHLETLAKVKTVAFDKTGTITTGEFVVTEFRTFGTDLSVKTLLYWVASIESKSSHPMAEALIDYAKLYSIEPRPEAVVEFHNYPGEGIHGKLNNQEIYIGNRRIAQRAHCETVPEIEDGASGGKTRGYIYCNGILAGWFSLSDTCRSGAVEAVNQLKSMKILTVMLTGDSHAAAAQAQKQLQNAIEVVHAELLPEDKARIITEFEGPVAMIGDGVNDAPALATADIGISMGLAGSALATETGNIILMSNDIRKVPKVIRLARRAYNKVIQNLILSIAIKGGILALAFAGHPLVWAAVLADVGTCLLVILNSMLLLRGKSRKRDEPDKCLKDPQQVFKLPVDDIENQTSERDVQIGSKSAVENAGSSVGCRRRCCAKTDDEAGIVLSEVGVAKNGSSIVETFRKRETPQAQGNNLCLKDCCSVENDESAGPEISLRITFSGSRPAGHSLETLTDSNSCAKGCCSIRNEITCAGSVADIDLLTVNSAKNIVEGFERSETSVPIPNKNCAKGCCGSNKLDKSATESLNSVNSGPNTRESITFLAQETSDNGAPPKGIKQGCTKECCGSNKRNNFATESSNTETGLSVTGECITKLPEKRFEKFETTAPDFISTCTKVCCGSNKTNDSVTESCKPSESGLNAGDSITKLTWESPEQYEPPAPVSRKSCTKGCCGSKKANPVAESDNTLRSGLGDVEKMEKTETAELVSRKNCTKGCCGKNSFATGCYKNSQSGPSDVQESITELAKDSKFETPPAPELSKKCKKSCCGFSEQNNIVTGLSNAEICSSAKVLTSEVTRESSEERAIQADVPRGCKKGCCKNKAAKPDLPTLNAEHSLE